MCVVHVLSRTIATNSLNACVDFAAAHADIARWADHQQNCGGEYIKIREPEGYKPRGKSKRQKTNETSANHSGLSSHVQKTAKIDTFFPPKK